jgi:hypothetical protein
MFNFCKYVVVTLENTINLSSPLMEISYIL